MKARLFIVPILVVSLALSLTWAGAAQPPQPPAPLRPMPGEGPGVNAQLAQNVELVGQIGGSVYAVALQGNYAYIGVGPRLVILNVSDQAHPAFVGQTSVLPDIVQGVAVVGDYAYVATDWSGLRIVNVANPAAPTEIGAYDTPGRAEGMAVVGNYAYVADYDQGLRIINIVNPATPSEVGFYDTPGEAFGVAVAGSYAYVADFYSGLRIVDVADPAHPSEVGSYTMGEAFGVAVAGTYAYVADGLSGLRIINVADPAAPNQVGSLGIGNALGVVVVGNYAYVAGGYRGCPDLYRLLRYARGSLWRGGGGRLCLRRRWMDWPEHHRHLQADTCWFLRHDGTGLGFGGSEWICLCRQL
jgi:hypothetical protein